MVINTRPLPGFGITDKLTACLQSGGANVVASPVIELAPNPDTEKLHRDIVDSAYRTAVFVSANGVHFFIDFLHREALDPLEWSTNRQIVAIGTGTYEALHQYGLSVDLIPPIFNSVSLAKELVDWMPDPYLLVRADRGSSELADLLNAANLQFIESTVYISRDVAIAPPAALPILRQGSADWLTLTSPAIAHASVKLFGGLLVNTKLICISEAVANVVKQSGFSNVWVAKSATFEAMAKKMRKSG